MSVDQADDERRNFLKRAGKVALATPPTMALLLKAEGRHYALAISGSNGNAFGQQGNGPGINGNGAGNLANGHSNSNH